MEETISLKELFETLRKRLSLILVLTFTAALVSAIVSFFLITPVYQVSTQILVNRSTVGENFNTNEVQTNIQLINTYSGIITSPRILDIVSDEMDGKYTTADLKDKVTVQSQDNSQILTVVVEDPDPKEAVAIANKVGNVFQKEVKKIMNVDNVNILTPAEVTDTISPVKPKPLLNIAIALVVGLMAGVGLAFLLEYLDNTLKTEQDVEKYLDLPVLGVITTFNGKSVAGNKNQRAKGV
ncbi:YveK family protein [Bacillus andreraoultii]|uniref:YveK family protein n=1 Tax=Bacillus andreraoultii TaxID=1499685 RepID=UPI000539ADF6|nr:Wzz/FepE/Etk N-terminal domain-containing protein [Bacillus andreraoultii]